MKKQTLLPHDRCHIIPFLMAGYPSLKESEELALHIVESGADVIEIGVPYSDALADGPLIQAAAEHALKQNVSLRDVLEMVGRIRARHPDVPLIIFSYLNPIYQMGYQAYAQHAAACGVSGTLVVDLPPEEADLFVEQHQAHGLATVFLTSPTTSAARLATIDSSSSGFVYAVSRTGVTGDQSAPAEDVIAELTRLKLSLQNDVVVGFGIATAAQVRTLHNHVDGIAIGSAFVRMIAEAKDFSEARNRIGERIQSFREVVRESVKN